MKTAVFIISFIFAISHSGHKITVNIRKYDVLFDLVSTQLSISIEFLVGLSQSCLKPETSFMRVKTGLSNPSKSSSVASLLHNSNESPCNTVRHRRNLSNKHQILLLIRSGRKSVWLFEKQSILRHNTL